MYFKNKMDEYNGEKLKIYIDMDGVVADYDIGNLDYLNKRPLTNNIKQFEEISSYSNIELYILSITRHNEGIVQKNEWLDKYMAFIKKENRIIISREENDMKRSKELKTEYLKNISKEDSKIILIDDDPTILDEVKSNCPDIILFKDTVLID